MFQIEDIMTKNVITVNPETPIQEAIKTIVENNMSLSQYYRKCISED